MKSVEALMHEHRVIEHGLAVLEAIADRIERGETVPTEKVAALLDFFRVFADECHHGKEEGVLFPELEARGIPKEGGPIGVMLHEHAEGRTLQQQMQQALSDLTSEANRQQFVAAAHNYIALLRQHIWKEDNVLFKMAEQFLTERDDEQLAARFDRHEREHIGEGVHERYHHLVHQLEAEFMAGTEHLHSESVRGHAGEKVLDVRTIPPRERHPLIFQTFEALKPGENFILVNDHDPKPLYYEFHYERQGQFTWEYLEQGPEVWRVRIGKVG
jgi:hemerythrin-like domain-containing protein/uncharacterized protein (DUF2249 family)